MLRLCFAAIIALTITASLPTSNASAQSSDGDVENRLLRLEEQMVDLSAQVGTIETIAKGSGGGLNAAPTISSPGQDVSNGSNDDRIGLMETQLHALSGQIGELIQRLNQLESGSGGAPQNFGGDGLQRQGAADGQIGNGLNEPAGSAGNFGTAIEGEGTSGQAQDGLNNYFGAGSGSQDSASSLQDSAPIRTAARSTPQAQSLYDNAYNALIQRNYRGAAGSFKQFVGEFPTDPLAGQAYFWLGEAAFVNGEYREAADSFLRSSTNYPQNQKAAESLLKLGISLKRLGESDAACSSFSELGQRFPDATAVLERAEREKQRAQC